jgi:phosphate transport system permease protein
MSTSIIKTNQTQGHDLVVKSILKKRSRVGEGFIHILLFVCGAFSIFTTVGIVIELGNESLLFFKQTNINLFKFFTTTVWQPTIGKFGVLPLLNATLMTTFFAILIALPLGLGAAIYLSEYASKKTRKFLKPVLEILAGIPTVVYGYFALTVMTPILRSIFGIDTVDIYNTLSAGLVMGIMILPMVCSISEDALSAVPRSLRDASYSLGATKLETTFHIVLPAALSGIVAAFILGFSRAIGETMIVAIAAGSGSRYTFNPFKSAETLTGYIARISGGDVGYDTPDYNSIFVIGLLLFAITLVLNLVSRRLSRKYREVYE